MNPAMPVTPEQYVYTPPAQAPPKPQAPVTPGRLRQEGLDESTRNIAVVTHLALPIAYFFPGMMFFGVLITLAVWLIYRSQSEFVADHGKDAVNFGFSLALYHLLVPLIPVLMIIMIVNSIRGAKAAHRSEYFRYPITIRFLK